MSLRPWRYKVGDRIKVSVPKGPLPEGSIERAVVIGCDDVSYIVVSFDSGTLDTVHFTRVEHLSIVEEIGEITP